MAFFDFLSKTPKRFVSENQFQKNLAKQLAMTPMTLQQLRKYGATPEKELKLEYFFYTNSPDKAAPLASGLGEKGYEVKHGLSASDKKLQIITGWTTKMPMSEVVVSSWTKEMCELGFAHDCDFDGWGTNPAQ